MGHNTLNELHGGRFVLGLGDSHAQLVSNVCGHEYMKPLATIRAHLDGMDAAWKATNTTPARKQVEVAASGPKMSELAAQLTLEPSPTTSRQSRR